MSWRKRWREARDEAQHGAKLPFSGALRSPGTPALVPVRLARSFSRATPQRRCGVF
jgi:hypothetical protein